MSDPNNPIPEDVITPPASPSDADPNLDPNGSEPGKRSAEARINELLSKNKELIEEVQGLKVKIDTLPVPTPITPPQPDNPEVDKAIKYLKQTGKFVDQNDLEERVRVIQDRMTLDSEHQRLENIYDGSDGRPKYDRNKAEEYMRKNGGMPSAAYKLMNETELLDWTIKQAEEGRKKKPYIAKPSSTAGIRDDNTITREKIAESMKTPEGRMWYEQNRKEILTLQGEGKL